MKALPDLDPIDHAIVRATQAGLPLEPRPYHAIARRVGTDAEDVMARLRRLLTLGVIRRIGVVPNHYAIGYPANGMAVWDVDDAEADRFGARLAASGLVSHCYLRDRRLPQWRYNLFAMVHGHDRSEVQRKLDTVTGLLGTAVRVGEVLYSTRILKKTGLRLAQRDAREDATPDTGGGTSAVSQER